jgi:uncharacterized protein YgiM (DUF1202 family)
MMKSRAFLAVLLLLAAGSAFAADTAQRFVNVKETQLRATPSYLGKTLGALHYGEKVTILEQPATAPRGWLKVESPARKLQGWVNASALDKKEIAMSAGTENASQSASSGDVALAGKGFNSDVEAQYKQNQKIDYTWVDNMQGVNDSKKEFKITPQQVATFDANGGLTGQGGAE